MATQATSKPKVHVESDALSGYIRLDPKEDHSDLTAEVILDALREAKVVVTEDVTARVESVCNQAMAGESSDPEYLVAEATLPQPPVDAELVLCEAVSHASSTPPEEAEGEDVAPVDYYAQCRLATVGEGEEIGVVIPAKAGVAGVDVLGKTLPVSGEARELALGEGVRLGDDGKTLFATTSGLVVTRDDKVAVVDVVQVDGDVDFNSGSVDVDSDVVVKGTVHDLFSVKSSKSVSIGGAIEAAQVEAGVDVVVHGGIAGREKGSVRAGDKVVCRFCDSATVSAGGDLTITKEAINSRLHTEAELVIPRGALIGGETRARGGAVIKELGSDAEVPTILTIGLDPVILAKVEKMDPEVSKRKAAAEKIRATVGPLIANIKRLAPDQRERATELMFEADSLDASADELVAEKDRMIEEGSWPEEPELVITDRIHPGVRVIFEEFEFVVRDVLRGPVRIFKRRMHEGVAAALMCVNTLSGSRRELFCRKYEAKIPSEADADADATPQDGGG